MAPSHGVSLWSGNAAASVAMAASVQAQFTTSGCDRCLPRFWSGAPAPAPFHGPACHQGFEGDGFVALARGEDQRHQLAPAFRTDMDFRTEAALTTTERFSLRALGVGPSRMLVRADDGAIHRVDIPVQLRCGVGLLLDRGKEASPDACLAPAVEAAGAGGPAAIPLGQITPRGTGTEDPQDAVEDASVVSGGAASVRFLRRKQGL
jgi:hypothetical protein